MIARLEAMLARFPIAAAVLYVAAIVLFVFTTLATVLDLADRRDALAASTDMLAKIEGRGPPRARAPSASGVTIPDGSPFVEGATVSVAGAALLQRVAAATTQVGGNILSSQVDLQGPQSKAGFVNVTASIEVEQASLQKLLYDLESGMPFLFVDQIDMQVSNGGAGAPDAGATSGKMRVQMTVSGQWQGTK
jgi:general secretion pathway protein M